MKIDTPQAHDFVAVIFRVKNDINDLQEKPPHHCLPSSVRLLVGKPVEICLQISVLVSSSNGEGACGVTLANLRHHYRGVSNGTFGCFV